MTTITATTLTEITAPSTKYERADYAAILTGLAKTKKLLGRARLEEDFVGVKPQHVAFMLKLELKERELTDEFAVVIDAKHGVCLYRKTA